MIRNFLKEENLSVLEFGIYAYLLELAGGRKRITVGLQKTAEILRISPARLKKGLTALEDRGYVRVYRRRTKDGKFAPYLIEIRKEILRPAKKEGKALGDKERSPRPEAKIAPKTNNTVDDEKDQYQSTNNNIVFSGKLSLEELSEEDVSMLRAVWKITTGRAEICIRRVPPHKLFYLIKNVCEDMRQELIKKLAEWDANPNVRSVVGLAITVFRIPTEPDMPFRSWLVSSDECVPSELEELFGKFEEEEKFEREYEELVGRVCSIKHLIERAKKFGIDVKVEIPEYSIGQFSSVEEIEDEKEKLKSLYLKLKGEVGNAVYKKLCEEFDEKTRARIEEYLSKKLGSNRDLVPGAEEDVQGKMEVIERLMMEFEALMSERRRRKEKERMFEERISGILGSVSGVPEAKRRALVEYLAVKYGVPKDVAFGYLKNACS